MTDKKAPSKKTTKKQKAEQEIQAGDASVAIGGSLTDSAIIHGQTIVLADRFWRDLKPALPPEAIKEATAAYLAYLTDRHYYLSLKGMGVSNRVPLKLKKMDIRIANIGATLVGNGAQVNTISVRWSQLNVIGWNIARLQNATRRITGTTSS